MQDLELNVTIQGAEMFYYYIRSLLELGKVDRGLELAKNMFYKTLQYLHNEITLFFSVAYAYALMNKGLYHEMLQLEKDSSNIIKNLISSSDDTAILIIIALFKNIIGNAYLLTAKLDLAYDYYKESLELRKNLQDESFIADSLLNIGLVFFNKGEYDKALNYEGQALEKYKKVNDKYGILNTTVNIAVLLYHQGKLDYVEKIINENLGLATSYKNIKFISAFYQLLGDIYENKGNLSDAIENFEKSYKMKEVLGNKKLLGDILTSIGYLYIEKNDYLNAIEYLDKALHDYKASGSTPGLIIATFWKFWIYYNLEQKNKMNQILKELENFATSNNDQRTNQIYLVAKVITMYQNNNSQIDESMANNLQGILDEDKIIDIRLSMLAITILCSYKICKLKAHDNEELKSEIDSIIDTIYNLGFENKSYKYMVISFILKTKFNLILGNIENSFESLKKGLEIAEKYELKRLMDEIKREEEKLLEKIDLWYTGIPVTPPLAEKIEESIILDYLKEIMKVL